MDGLGQKIPLDGELVDLGMQLRHLSLPTDLHFGNLVVECLNQGLNCLPLPLRHLIWVKLVLRCHFRNRPFATDRLKRKVGLERGRKPSASLHGGSSFSSDDLPYALSQKLALPLSANSGFMVRCQVAHPQVILVGSIWIGCVRTHQQARKQIPQL